MKNDSLIERVIIRRKSEIVELLDSLSISGGHTTDKYGDDLCSIHYGGKNDLSIVRVGDNKYNGHDNNSCVKKRWDTSTKQGKKEIVSYLWERRKKLNVAILIANESRDRFGYLA